MSKRRREAQNTSPAVTFSNMLRKDGEAVDKDKLRRETSKTMTKTKIKTKRSKKITAQSFCECVDWREWVFGVAVCLIYSWWSYCILSSVSMHIHHELFDRGSGQQSRRGNEWTQAMSYGLAKTRALKFIQTGWLPQLITDALLSLSSVFPLLPSPLNQNDSGYGTMIDLRDAQYRDWRNALPLQIALFVAFAAISWIICGLIQSYGRTDSNQLKSTAAKWKLLNAKNQGIYIYTALYKWMQPKNKICRLIY